MLSDVNIFQFNSTLFLFMVFLIHTLQINRFTYTINKGLIIIKSAVNPLTLRVFEDFAAFTNDE